MTASRVLKFGVIGIGNAGGGVLGLMKPMPQVDVVAIADVRPHARDTFQREFGGRAYDSAEKLCEDPDVEAVWVATPNPFHAPHTILAAQHGKHAGPTGVDQIRRGVAEPRGAQAIHRGG